MQTIKKLFLAICPEGVLGTKIRLVLALLTCSIPMGAQDSTLTERVNGVSFTMVRVLGGRFAMGCTAEQAGGCRSNEYPAHQATMSDYFIGETEVTRALWNAVMKTDAGKNTTCGDCPIDDVTWSEVQRFIGELNALTGKAYRLPTEAEWEFAARGGQKGEGHTFSGGQVVQDLAWMKTNAEGKTHPVKSKIPNELGLYDLSGNVWEWCSDWYGAYTSESQTDPTGPSTGTYRVIRGGDFKSSPPYCRLSVRFYGIPDGSEGQGFRLALQ